MNQIHIHRLNEFIRINMNIYIYKYIYYIFQSTLLINNTKVLIENHMLTLLLNCENSIGVRNQFIYSCYIIH